MTTGSRIRVAGPQNGIQIGLAVQHARTHLFVRQRVHDVVQDARPRRRIRGARGSMRWPGDLSNVI
jgi:hypothetical protein